MTYEQVFAQLSDPRGMSQKGVRAAVKYAEQLSPIVKSGLAQRRQGDAFTRKTRNQLFFGLYACAAAPRRELWPEWVAFMQADRETFEDLFGLLDELAAARLTLCLIDATDSNQIDTLFELLENKSLFWAVRYGLWLALARLTEEGSVALKRTLDFIEAYPKVHVVPGDDCSLFGWMYAVILLRRMDLMPEVEHQWATAPVFSHQRDIDLKGYRETMQASHSKSGFWLYDGMGIAPFDDPVDGITRKHASLAA